MARDLSEENYSSWCSLEITTVLDVTYRCPSKPLSSIVLLRGSADGVGEAARSHFHAEAGTHNAREQVAHHYRREEGIVADGERQVALSNWNSNGETSEIYARTHAVNE